MGRLSYQDKKRIILNFEGKSDNMIEMLKPVHIWMHFVSNTTWTQLWLTLQNEHFWVPRVSEANMSDISYDELHIKGNATSSTDEYLQTNKWPSQRSQNCYVTTASVLHYQTPLNCIIIVRINVKCNSKLANNNQK